MKRICISRFCILLLSAFCVLPSVSSAQWPSVFRGVIVADGALGVRIVSVEERSQAALCDLRPEDVIVQVNGVSVRTIDQFATVSDNLRGNIFKTSVVVLRNGQPRELILHLYSLPILSYWELSFLPEHDLRFIDPAAAVSYWSNLGRGFETAGQFERALNCYLNGLHNDPHNLDIALKVSELLWRIGRGRLEAHRLGESITALQQATVLLTHAFDRPLTEEQLQQVKSQLQQTLDLLRRHRAAS